MKSEEIHFLKQNIELAGTLYKPETQAKRGEETGAKAEQNIRANQWRQ